MTNSPILADISAALASLRKSEIKVAEFVLAHPKEVVSMRVVDLAEQAQVSEPTIVRFCRGVGCPSFQEFKMRVAQEMAIYNNREQFAIQEEDSIQEICDKVSDTTIQRLDQIKTQLSNQQVDQAVQAISQANRVEFYGFGASGAVAIDAQHKFFRLQVATAAYSDPHMQAMSAVTLCEQDVVVAISQSGRTKDLLHSVELAQQKKAKVISLAPQNTPLSQLADLPIHINIEEDTSKFIPMTSRIAHLMMIDILAIAVTQRRGPDFAQHLNEIKRSIQSLRVEENP